MHDWLAAANSLAESSVVEAIARVADQGDIGARPAGKPSGSNLDERDCVAGAGEMGAVGFNGPVPAMGSGRAVIVMAQRG